MSPRVAFSASLTWTPPIPRKPPSEEASAIFWLMLLSQAWLSTGKPLAQRLLDRGSSFRCLVFGDDGLYEFARTGISLRLSQSRAAGKAFFQQTPTNHLVLLPSPPCQPASRFPESWS